jgi:DNA-binding response OmpR family regulator
MKRAGINLKSKRSDYHRFRYRSGQHLASARHRVLIADDDTPMARRLCDYLWDHGFEARVTSRISEAKEIVEFWSPDTVFIDLLLPETNALSLFRFIQTRNLKKRPRIVVMSRQSMASGIEQMRKAGAAHYLIKPFSLEDAFRAVLPAETPAVAEVREAEEGEGAKVIPLAPRAPKAPPAAASSPVTLNELHLLNLFLKQALISEEPGTGLHKLMRMMNLKTGAIRTSLIRCLNAETGIVLASNDDENVKGLPLDLRQYPEIREVRSTLRPVIIPNVRTCDILEPVQTHLRQTPFETIVLFPVFRFGSLYGVMSVRMEQRDPIELFYVERFGSVCAQIISLAIGTPGQSLVNE